MGNWANKYYLDPLHTPDHRSPPTFDSAYGFPNGRKARVMVATEEEMKSAKIPLEDRDYCAHYLIKYKACKAKNWPWAVKCKHEKHEWDYCEYEDWVLRMKEFERERRLLQRMKRKEARAAKEAMAA